MKKKICILSIIILLILLYVIYNSPFREYDYFSSRKSCIKYLNKNITKLERIFNEVEYVSEEPNFKLDDGKEYIVKICGPYSKYVKLDIDAQGMLGGQYWGLIYCTEDYLDGKKIEIIGETGEGNNVFITEKIKDNWYFFYEDYDGKVDTNKVKGRF